jgi:hypothetical protein
MFGVDSNGSGDGPVVTSYEYDKEPSGSIKVGEIFDQLRTFRLLKKDFARLECESKCQ